jgi:hypothetical protein
VTYGNLDTIENVESLEVTIEWNELIEKVIM